MGRRWMADAVPDPAPRYQPGVLADHAGAILARAADRTRGRAMDPAQSAALPPVGFERRRGRPGMRDSAGHRQPVWSRQRHTASGRGVCTDLSPAGGENRASLSLLSSGLLQRHLFLRPRGRIAGSGHAGIFRIAMGRERGDGAAAGGLDRGVHAAVAHRPRSQAGPAMTRHRSFTVAAQNQHRLFTPLYRVAALLTMIAAASAADLTHTIDTLVDANPSAARSSIGIYVVDLKAGKPLYTRNENRLFLPASNMKLFTTALALEKLGPDYRFETRLIQEPSGDLALIGSGDPSLSGRAYPYRRDATSGPALRAIEDLADQAIAAGLTAVRGDIVGDDRLYPWVPFPPNWSQSDALGESGAPISALSVADNFITITFAAGAKPGDLATLSIAPALEYFAVDNRIQTVAGAGEAQIRMTRAPGSRQLLFDGTMPAAAAKVYANVAVDDPALYAACALYDALTRRGVAITGRPIARHRAPGDSFKAPEGSALAMRLSPPASEL